MQAFSEEFFENNFSEEASGTPLIHAVWAWHFAIPADRGAPRYRAYGNSMTLKRRRAPVFTTNNTNGHE
jgi:hypothetical protein